jgi:hypothetical protein
VAKGKGNGKRGSQSKGSKGKYRSAAGGRYVSSKYGERHANTTVKESK